MKEKRIFRNIFVSGWTRVVIMILGLIMPRVLITSFGSEVNGLLSTVTQIFTYLALLEAGIGTSTVNALYKPLINNNCGQVNEVVTEARRYYRKVSLVYAGSIVIFAIIYPFLANSALDKFLIFKIIILQGAASFLNYYFSAVYSQLLVADGRKYVLENIHFVSYILQTVGKIVLIYLGFDVIVVQIMALIMSIIRIPVLKVYARRKYVWLDFKTMPKQRYLKERKAFVVHEFATIIFHNTDVFLVSAFSGFVSASIYTVYNMIYSSLYSLLTTVNSGLGFVLGKKMQRTNEELRGTYDIYNSLYIAATFVLFTTAALLTKPFLTLYTVGINDASYIMPGLTLLFVVINLLSGVRSISSSLITVSGHADKTKIRSLIEAGINLAVSLILGYFIGIYGILLGTIVALLYRSNDIIIYANRKILKRSPLHNYVGILINIAAAIGVYCLTYIWNPIIDNYFSLLLYAIFFVIMCSIIYSVIAIATNVKAYSPYLKIFKQKIFSIIKRRNGSI